MKALRILSRSFRDAFKGVFRNFSLSLASISCITITLLVVSLSLILTKNVNNVASLIEEDVTIVAFLDVDITEEDTNKVLDEIKKLDNIEEVNFQSKTEIASEMKDSSEFYANIMNGWTEDENPLQSTYLVKVKDIESIGKTADELKKIEHIETVKYGEGMVEQLVSVFKIVRNISIGTVIALIIVTVFLITNTIKITIYSRKREIEIMRLVGASNVNIKIPFLFEGLYLGIMGAIIPIVVTFYGYSLLFEKFNGVMFSQFLKLVEPLPFLYSIIGILLLIGMFVGMLGSLQAVRKYLKI